jgi:choline dehydrogenase
MQQETFDYIIVGAGSAGSALASRLSADPRNKVLLLEAGKPSHPLSPIPVSFARLINNPMANWCYSSEPEASAGNRQIPVPRGKLLGGSSSINGMVFVRGQKQDFDHWAQLGNRGWSYEDVLPIFKKMESYDGGNDEFRGRDGPLKVSDIHEGGPIYDSIFAAAESVGIKRNPDYNGPVQDGIAMTQASIRDGRRMSTAHCYLDPARGRPNLKIVTEAMTEKVLLEGKRCTGVRYAVNGQSRDAKARREVIISAGAINSPQILELSGIGNPEVLAKGGIEVQHALPGVGENLRDHWAPRMKWYVGAKGVTYNDRARGIGLGMQVLRYAFTRKGFLSLPASPMRAYVRTRDGLEGPDACIMFMPFLATPDYKLDKRAGITLTVHQLRPESTGSIHVKSRDPQVAPAINFNFLSASLDREVLLENMRIARRVMEAPALGWVKLSEFAPGKDVQSDQDLLDWVSRSAETAYHPVGTCKMGSDRMAVVDDRLRVRGIEGLRIADASIMPTLTSGNTNAPSIMIGEKAAMMVLEAAVQKAAA